VALAITDWGHHTGVITRTASGVDFIHLATHDRLIYESFDTTRYPCWVVPELSDTDGRLIASLARRVVSAYHQGGLPYAIKKSAGIANDGTVVFGEGGAGFTCATFVLALFEGVNIQLIDDSDWQVLAEDVLWQGSIIELFRASGRVGEDHLRAQESNIGCFRFRPEDVAAAAMIADSSPNDFATIRPLAAELVVELEAQGI